MKKIIRFIFEYAGVATCTSLATVLLAGLIYGAFSGDPSCQGITGCFLFLWLMIICDIWLGELKEWSKEG